MQEDPTFRVHTDEDTGQTLISGMGELHLEIITDRLVREFNVGANGRSAAGGLPRDDHPRSRGRGSLRRQSGGRGQFGHAKIRLRPTDRRPTSRSTTRSPAAVIPREFIKPTEQGICAKLMEPPARWPASRSTVSRSISTTAASTRSTPRKSRSRSPAPWLWQDASKSKANLVLLEPVMAVEVVTPEEYMGDVMGDLNSRRGRVQSMEARGNAQVITAKVPPVRDVRLRHRPALPDPGPC